MRSWNDTILPIRNFASNLTQHGSKKTSLWDCDENSFLEKSRSRCRDNHLEGSSYDQLLATPAEASPVQFNKGSCDLSLSLFSGSASVLFFTSFFSPWLSLSSCSLFLSHSSSSSLHVLFYLSYCYLFPSLFFIYFLSLSLSFFVFSLSLSVYLSRSFSPQLCLDHPSKRRREPLRGWMPLSGLFRTVAEYGFGEHSFKLWALFGCSQRTIASKTRATSHGVGNWRGVNQELANFGATLCTKSCPPTKSAFKIRLARSWPRVGHGLPTFGTNISVLKLQGSSCSSPLATPKRWDFWHSTSSGGRTQWVPSSLVFVWPSKLTESLAELTELGAELSELVLSAETVLSKQYISFKIDPAVGDPAWESDNKMRVWAWALKIRHLAMSLVQDDSSLRNCDDVHTVTLPQATTWKQRW